MEWIIPAIITVIGGIFGYIIHNERRISKIENDIQWLKGLVVRDVMGKKE